VTATVTVRTTVLEVRINGVLDAVAYAASCSFGFDQRVAEATVRRTGGGSIAVAYWDPVEIRMGTTPGGGAAVRFVGYVVPVDNQLFPIEGTLTCKGRLFRAQWVRNQVAGGTRMAPAGTGRTDQLQVGDILTACGVPYLAANIGGTGKPLGSQFIAWNDVLTPGPFTWTQGEPGLAYIERLDEVSVPDDASGRYRTFETLGGDVFRVPMATAPKTTPDFSFTEGVDVLEARITRDPAGAANRVTVDGAPLPITDVVPGVVPVKRYVASSTSAPYLPPGLPTEPDGHAYVGTTFTSPMIEKRLVADSGSTISCEAVARFLLAEYNCVLDTLEFSTPRDDLLGPGQTIHLHSPRLGITDAAQHYWLQRLEITMDEQGAFTQRLTCIRKS
jgi:hypothetical protein